MYFFIILPSSIHAVPYGEEKQRRYVDTHTNTLASCFVHLLALSTSTVLQYIVCLVWCNILQTVLSIELLLMYVQRGTIKSLNS